MEEPLVSICCLTYNHEPYIRQCLDGFMMQQCDFRFEVIVHDDASIDGTAQVLREYEQKYPDQIRVIYQTENQWSKGIRPSPTYVWPNAKGKYIAICEGDDYWIDPFKLQNQADFLEKNSDYVLVGGYAKKIYESEGYQIIHDNPIYKADFDFDTSFLFLQNPLSTLTVCFRNRLINELPVVYFKGTGGDRRLYMLLAQYGKCRYVHEAWGVYRIHGGGVTNKYKGNFSSELNGIRESINNTKNWNVYFEGKYDNEANAVVAKLAARAIKLSLKNGSFKNAVLFLDQADLNNMSFKMRLICLLLRVLK